MEYLTWGSNNNGNLQTSTELVGNDVAWGSLTGYGDSYSYDSLNRLTGDIDSNGTCGGTCWSRNFQYDPFGNMWVTSNVGVPLAGNTPTSNIYNAANNQMNGQTYDAAGNQTSVNGNTALYDAENRLSSVSEAPAFGGGTETYGYDTSGRRVQKIAAGGSLTAYVYDALGQLATEYSPGGTLSKEYIRFDGHVAAVENAAGGAACQTCYFSYDHLGSVRMVTD